MILLPETDLEGAAVVAEKVRSRIQEHVFESGGGRIPVTMTFGVCGWGPSMTVDECTRLADEALYAGKREGKNRVIRAAPVADPGRGTGAGEPAH